MANAVERAQISLLDRSGRSIGQLLVISKGGRQTGATPDLVLLDPSEAINLGEERVQLLENRRYELQFTLSRPLIPEPNRGLHIFEPLDADSEVTSPRRFSGLLDTYQLDGTLSLRLLDPITGNPIAAGRLEVRTEKLNYRQDFRQMLDFIAERSTALLIQLRSISETYFESHPARDAETATQRYYFVRSILQSQDLQDAISRIVAAPHNRVKLTTTMASPSRGIRQVTTALRDFSRATKRLPVPAGHPLREKIETLPASIQFPFTAETTDTDENRFVKHAMQEFSKVLNDIKTAIDSSGERTSTWDLKLIEDIKRLEAQVSTIVDQGFLRNLPPVRRIPISSVALQRKPGYREVLRAWLQLQAAATLLWQGSEDIYGGGRRNVSKLYEYWTFFKLIDVLEAAFNIRLPQASQLISKTADGLSLMLKSGQTQLIRSSFAHGSHRLQLSLGYNRSFPGSDPGATPRNKSDGRQSWSSTMIPDCTVSIWPSEYAEADAMERGLLAHLHFDAKYKIAAARTDGVATATDVFGPNDEYDPEANESERRIVESKRADLHKMHAYKDAIPGTLGAYVLFPGNRGQVWREKAGILPSIGAFPLNPSTQEEDAQELIRFLQQAVDHITTEWSRKAN